MAETLDWVFEGIDKLSGPAGKMSSSLGGFSIELNQGIELLKKFGEAVSWVGEKAMSFGEFAIEAISFKESTLVAYETILGTKQEAQALFNKAQQFADLSPFKTHDVVTSFQKLLGAGFTQTEVPIVFQAIGDIASFQSTKGEMHQVMESMSNDLTRMMSRGFADQHHLNQMFAASGGILNPTKFYEALGKAKGVTAAQAMEMVTQRAVTSKDAVIALIDTVKKLEGGPIGTSILKNAYTIKGLFSTMDSLAENFFTSMEAEVENIPGVLSFKETLSNIIKYFNVLGPTGQRVMKDIEAVFGGAMKAIFGGLGGEDGFARIQMFMEPILQWFEGIDWDQTFGRVGKVVESVGAIITGVFGGLIGTTKDSTSSMGSDLGRFIDGIDVNQIRETAREFGNMAAQILEVFGAISKLIQPFSEANEGFKKFNTGFNAAADSVHDFLFAGGKEGGENMMAGIGEGLDTRQVDVNAKVEKMATDSIAAMAGPNGIDAHSPSRAFAELGGYSAQGYAAGIDESSDEVVGALGRMGRMGPPSGAGGAGGGAGGRGASAVHIAPGAFHVDARGADGETIARKLEELMPSALANAMDLVATEGGA